VNHHRVTNRQTDGQNYDSNSVRLMTRAKNNIQHIFKFTENTGIYIIKYTNFVKCSQML